MKQQISLTPSTDTIHVDEVRVEDGVYFKTKPEFIDEDMKYDCWIWFLIMSGHELSSVSPKTLNEKWNRYKSLCDAINFESDADFFTLSGRRIVTEKSLTVADLKDNDNVSFEDGAGNKGHIVFVYPNFVAVNSNGIYWNTDEYGNYGEPVKTMQLALNNVSTCVNGLKSATRWDKRSDMYKWLGED